jgi:deoxyribonuclease V
VAGADVAFSPDGSQVIAGVVVWDSATRTVVEQKLARVVCRFPYIPGLLSFREMPAVLAAFRKLRTEPQVVLCDGQGLAHPRRVGLACHLGLWLERPTIGCAKSRLCGVYTEPPVEKGRFSPLLLDGEQAGVVLRTRTAVKPLFVSPGHLCDHESAVRLTLAATTRFRLPEPTRLAHQLVSCARYASG